MSELKPKPITLKGAGPSALDDLPLTAQTDVVERDEAIVAHADSPELKLAVKALMRTGRSAKPQMTEPELPPMDARLPAVEGAPQRPPLEATPSDEAPADASPEPSARKADEVSVVEVAPAQAQPPTRSPVAKWPLMLIVVVGVMGILALAVLKLIEPADVPAAASAPRAPHPTTLPGGTSAPPVQTSTVGAETIATETTTSSPTHSPSGPVRTTGPSPSADPTAQAPTAVPTVLPTGPTTTDTTTAKSSAGIYIMKPKKEQP